MRVYKADIDRIFFCIESKALYIEGNPDNLSDIFPPQIQILFKEGRKIQSEPTLKASKEANDICDLFINGLGKFVQIDLDNWKNIYED